MTQRTFSVGMICRFPNPELYGQAIEYARSKGVPVYFLTTKGSFKFFPNLEFSMSLGYLCGNNEKVGLKSEITIPEFFHFCDNWIPAGSKPSEGEYFRQGDKVKVSNNGDYWREDCTFFGFTNCPNGFNYVVVTKLGDVVKYAICCRLEDEQQNPNSEAIRLIAEAKEEIEKSNQKIAKAEQLLNA